MTGRKHPARVAGPALEAHFQLLRWLLPAVEKFPRSQKFTLGDRIAAIGLEILEDLVEASYTRQRRSILTRANLRLQKLRVLCRLAQDLAHLPGSQYEHAMREVDGVGRLVGGWLKQAEAHGGREGEAHDLAPSA